MVLHIRQINFKYDKYQKQNLHRTASMSAWGLAPPPSAATLDYARSVGACGDDEISNFSCFHLGSHPTTGHRNPALLQGVSKQNKESPSKIEFIPISIKISRGVRTASKSENRNPGERRRRAQPTSPFATVQLCRQSSARQHRATTEADERDGNPIPGGRRASHGGGGASNVSARRSNLKLY